PAEVGDTHVDAAGRQDALQLGKLLLVAGGEDEARVGHEPSAARCSRVSSAHPATPRFSSSSRSSRPNGSRSAGPWISTKLPSPVHTTFMSVCAATSSS